MDFGFNKSYQVWSRGGPIRWERTCLLKDDEEEEEEDEKDDREYSWKIYKK